MTINYANLPDWLQWLVGLTVVAAAIAGLVLLVRRTWPIVTKFVNTINSLSDLPQFMITTAATLEQQDVKIEDIHHQTHENNGGSITDGLKRVESTLTKNTSRLTAMERRQGRIEKGVAGLYTRVDENEAAAVIDRKNIADAREELENTRPRSKP